MTAERWSESEVAESQQHLYCTRNFFQKGPNKPPQISEKNIQQKTNQQKKTTRNSIK